MKKSLATILLLTVLIFTACAHQRKTAIRKKGKPVKAAGTAGISSISMGRGACFGRCPTYTLIVNSDGRAQYKGRMFTERIGVYEKTFPAQKAAALMQTFVQYRVDTCAANYEQPVADLPGIFYKITRNGKVQEIGNAHFGPRFLKDLARQMDEQFPIDASWKKISDDVPE